MMTEREEMQKPVRRNSDLEVKCDMFDLSLDDLAMRVLDYEWRGDENIIGRVDHSSSEGLRQDESGDLKCQYTLPFDDFSFDFALSSNYLFAGFVGQTVDNTLQIIRELARVAKDVRIFPLVDRKGLPSPMLGPVLLALQAENYGVEIRDVAYHTQPLGNAMIRVWAKLCRLEPDYLGLNRR